MNFTTRHHQQYPRQPTTGFVLISKPQLHYKVKLKHYKFFDDGRNKN